VTAVNSPLLAALGDRYVLERVLGRGGMATVYLANDLRHDRSVALKVMRALVSSIITLPELAVSAATDILSGFLFQHAPS
jgi:serine/threonine protein kinase